MVSINPGELRHKVSFYTLQTVSDGAGGTEGIPTEVLAFSTLAMVQQKSGQRADEAGSVAIYSFYKMVIRYSKDKIPVANMIIKHKGRTMLVNAITDMDENQMLIELIVGKS